MPKWKSKVFETCEKNGFGEQVAEAIWKVCSDSADYSFNKCLSLDSIIEKSDGFDLISNVKIGDSVLAYNEDKKIDEFVEVVDIHSNNVELYEVEFEDGRILKCSIDHKLLCDDGKMHRLEHVLKNNLRVMTD